MQRSSASLPVANKKIALYRLAQQTRADWWSVFRLRRPAGRGSFLFNDELRRPLLLVADGEHAAAVDDPFCTRQMIERRASSLAGNLEQRAGRSAQLSCSRRGRLSHQEVARRSSNALAIARQDRLIWPAGDIRLAGFLVEAYAQRRLNSFRRS
ncbi:MULTISPECIES: hypothetical protein [Bradyrhizobium]|uniref:hypothetical protein n=1 Tax=Bradyrhizobium TaxID=374 RepID=UPI0027144C6F|nr:hypothetical protein [Bradyrhizobium elkanii]WLB83020.1 hypothetical protein QIH83_10870 [Bradyrhizobium elkanii]